MKKLATIYVIGLAGMIVGLQAVKAATIAHYTFEDSIVGTPATTITDSAGANDGTATGGPI